jgi:hypothetical protein
MTMAGLLHRDRAEIIRCQSSCFWILASIQAQEVQVLARMMVGGMATPLSGTPSPDDGTQRRRRAVRLQGMPRQGRRGCGPVAASSPAWAAQRPWQPRQEGPSGRNLQRWALGCPLGCRLPRILVGHLPAREAEFSVCDCPNVRRFRCGDVAGVKSASCAAQSSSGVGCVRNWKPAAPKRKLA